MKSTIASFSSQDEIADKISQDLGIWRSPIEYWKFSDWNQKIVIGNPEDNIEGKWVFYLGDISDISKFNDNALTMYAITWNFAERFNAIIPYFSPWRMDTIKEKWQVASAVWYSRIFAATPPAQWWKAKFHFFDIHNLDNQFFWNDNSWFRLHTAMDMFKEQFKWIPDLAIAFPDAWAKNRFAKYFKWYEIIECSKEKDWAERDIRILNGESEWRNIIIIDDLADSWWTLIKCGIELRRCWAKSVSAAVTHAVCPNDSHIRIADNFDTFYTTNTIPDRKEKFADISNIKVFDMYNLYKELINREIEFLK